MKWLNIIGCILVLFVMVYRANEYIKIIIINNISLVA